MIVMIINIKMRTVVIQKGASTQIQGQSITLQSFNTTNTTETIPNKPPIPTPLLFELFI